MAYQTGISGFARVPGAADPNKVYALGKGGRAIADAADLMTATGASSVAEAWKLAKVQTFTPEKAYSFGIRGTGIYATKPTSATTPASVDMPKITPIARPAADSLSRENLAAERGKLALGEGAEIPITVVPKKPLINDFAPGVDVEEKAPDVTVSDLAGLGERFGISGFGEMPAFRTGLTSEQQRNIETLIKTKPQSTWSDKDWTDYRWATEAPEVAPALTGNLVIDAYNKREDVQRTIEKAFPGQDPFKRGTEANTWLNNWWNRTGQVEMAEQVPVEEDIAIVTGDNLVDYYNQRSDVKDAAAEAFPGQDPLQQGTEANAWLETWWDTTGKAEALDEASKGTFSPTGELEEMVEPYAEPLIGTGTDIIDYYNHRPDVIETVKEAFPGQDPFIQNTPANDWLNEWFETTGKAEMADEVSKGTFAPTVAPTPDADTIVPGADDEKKTAVQSIVDKIRELFGVKKEAFEGAAEELGLEEKSQKITDIETTIQDRKEYYAAEKEKTANRLASGHVIAAEQATLEGERIAEMTNLEIRQAIAQGNWDRAHQLAKDTAQDAYDAAELEIKALEVQGQIDAAEKDDLIDMLKFHTDLLLNDFVAITREEADDLPVNSYVVFPDGSIYALPPIDEEAAEAEVDPNIGKTVKVGDNVFMWNTDTQAFDINVGPGGASDAVNNAKIQAADTAITLLDKINDNSGLSGAVGPTFITRDWGWGQLTGQHQSFVGDVESMLSTGTLNALINAKAQGATFGALSDAELVLIGNSFSKIKQWQKIKDGKVVGYSIDENAFRAEIKLLREATVRFKESLSFNSVEGDTNAALISAAGNEDGEKGGQCGSWVRKVTGLRVGDTFASKMSKMDESIKTPEPGMIFVMPYKKTGHIGIILSIKDGKATVKDSNWKLDGKILTHTIDLSRMTGFSHYSHLA